MKLNRKPNLGTRPRATAPFPGRLSNISKKSEPKTKYKQSQLQTTTTIKKTFQKMERNQTNHELEIRITSKAQQDSEEQRDLPILEGSESWNPREGEEGAKRAELVTRRKGFASLTLWRVIYRKSSRLPILIHTKAVLV